MGCVIKKDLEVSVGMSRKWDAREAGREVASSLIKNLSRPPNLVMLYATIHYEKYGGFEEFLKGVWKVLPRGTPLIGGTVAGFINRYGCFTRGASALAISHPKMDVAIGVGEDTRKNPKKAAEKCAHEILGKQRHIYDVNLLFDVVSGPEMPSFFGRSLPIVTNQGFIAALGPKYLEMSVKYLKKGQGMEDDVVSNLADIMQDYIIFGGSSGDSNDLVVNYQFANEKVFRNSLVGMGLNTSLKIDFAHSHGLSPTGVKFKATKKAQGSRIIKELDGKSAADTFFGEIGIPKDKLDNRILRITFFYPLGFKADDGHICPNAIGAVLKDSIAFNYSIKGDEIELLTTSGKKLIEAVDEAIHSLKISKPDFGLIISCLARLETLGVNIFKVREKLLDYFQDSPFLLVYSCGENIRFPNEEAHHFNETFNIFVGKDF